MYRSEIGKAKAALSLVWPRPCAVGVRWNSEQLLREVFVKKSAQILQLRDRLTYQIFVSNVIPLIRPEFLSPWLYCLLTDAPKLSGCINICRTKRGFQEFGASVSTVSGDKNDLRVRESRPVSALYRKGCKAFFRPISVFHSARQSIRASLKKYRRNFARLLKHERRSPCQK